MGVDILTVLGVLPKCGVRNLTLRRSGVVALGTERGFDRVIVRAPDVLRVGLGVLRYTKKTPMPTRAVTPRVMLIVVQCILCVGSTISV
jgi:hypothetical protein